MTAVTPINQTPEEERGQRPRDGKLRRSSLTGNTKDTKGKAFSFTMGCYRNKGVEKAFIGDTSRQLKCERQDKSTALSGFWLGLPRSRIEVAGGAVIYRDPYLSLSPMI